MRRVLLILFISIPIGTIYSANYHVRPGGNDNNSGLSFQMAFKTLQTATNRVKAGDTVFVYDGLYKGFDHFYKNSGTAAAPIVYLAAGDEVIINQSCGRGFDGLNIEGSHYIIVDGFKVYGIADPVGSGEDGIRAVLADHITIRNCVVDSCYRGIFTGYTDDFLAENNLCFRSYGEHGIYVSNNSDRVIVRNNICYNNKAAGIQLNPDLSSGGPGLSYNVRIYNNVCYNNRIGLNLQGLYYSEVYNNLIYNNGSGGGGNGITLFHGDAASGCNDVKVYNNTVIVPLGSQWCILAIESDSLFVYNNILLSSSVKGCLDIESSCTNYFGDYNLITDKMTINQGNSYINASQWKSMGNDLHSMVVNDFSLVFENPAAADFHLKPDSPAKNIGTSRVSDIVKDDLDGINRPQGIAYDAGAYEFVEPTIVVGNKTGERIHLIQNGNQLLIAGDEGDCKIRLFNMNGQFVLEGSSISTNQLTNGNYVYILQKTNTNITFKSGTIIILNE